MVNLACVTSLREAEFPLWYFLDFRVFFRFFFLFFGFQDLALVLSAVEMQSPNHWTASEVPVFFRF